MFHNKINKRIDQVEFESKTMDEIIISSTAETFGDIGVDINRLRNKVKAMESYFGIQLDGNNVYTKMKRSKNKKVTEQVTKKVIKK
jgi:hypothetical protein